MLSRFSVQSFKSLANVEVELGQLNVFVGGNGSGKSNLLEAIGVLSAAAEGRVEDGPLLLRGVRPGVPKLYKSAFDDGKHLPKFIDFSAESAQASYRVTLHNPLKDPSPAWKYQSESLREQQGGNQQTLVARASDSKNAERGLAALEAVKHAPGSPGMDLLERLQKYVIFTPTTAVLRGAPEGQPHRPVGLSGGRLPEAVQELAQGSAKNPAARSILEDALRLIDWAEPDIHVSPSASGALSPAAASSPTVLWFHDRYMRKGRNRLSGYDVSEGALYILLLAVLAAHPLAPSCLAIDNADHGLNPRLLTRLMQALAGWLINSPDQRQILLTSHNPAVLDGLPLQDERVRLFTVDRDNLGRTVVRRIRVDEKLLRHAREGWTLSRLWMNGLLGGVPDV